MTVRSSSVSLPRSLLLHLSGDLLPVAFNAIPVHGVLHPPPPGVARRRNDIAGGTVAASLRRFGCNDRDDAPLRTIIRSGGSSCVLCSLLPPSPRRPPLLRLRSPPPGHTTNRSAHEGRRHKGRNRLSCQQGDRIRRSSTKPGDTVGTVDDIIIGEDGKTPFVVAVCRRLPWDRQ